jgi:methylated-DNA-[protein]-cysteine S-methyltransferase
MKTRKAKFDLRSEVYTACRKIPRGKVSTYREIARAIGRPKSWRAVGNALSKNPHFPKVPCHRVVRSDGRVGGFAFGRAKKVRLLKDEGILLKNDKVQNLANFFQKLS